MYTVLLVIDIMAAAAMILLILIQRSEGGALGMGGGGGGLVTGRGAANLLTRSTAILAAVFFTASLALGALSHRTVPTSAVGIGLPPASPGAPANEEPSSQGLPDLKVPKRPGEAPAATSQQPAAPAQPQVPQSQ